MARLGGLGYSLILGNVDPVTALATEGSWRYLIPNRRRSLLKSETDKMNNDGMLFVAHWTHTPENCPGRSKEGATMLNEFWAKRDLAAKKGIKILSGYVAVTEHTYYITVQAKDYQSMLEFFEPLASTQTGGIHPVTTMDEWTKHIDPKRKG